MQITMMGYSGAGKTCYMYAMAALMSRPQHGFAFVPADHFTSLKLKRCWREMQHQLDDGGNIVKRGVWPASTAMGDSQNIAFKLVYNTRKLEEFTWFDYRGGALETEDATDSDYKDFDKMVKKSSVLIVGIPAEMLRDYMHDDGEATDRLSGLCEHLINYKDANKHSVPVAFAVLKADTLKSGEFSKGVQALRNGVFSPLFSKEEDWFLMFVGVSLGNFDNSRHEIDPETNRAFVFGKFAPVNVQLPVFFGIYCQLTNEIASMKRQLKDYVKAQQQAKDKMAKHNSRSRFGRWWNSDERESIENELKQLAHDSGLAQANMKSLIGDFDKIADELLGDDIVELWIGGVKR